MNGPLLHIILFRLKLIDMRPSIDDHPVPNVPFVYNCDVDLEVKPIPALCGDFIITINDNHMPNLIIDETKQFTLTAPQNTIFVIPEGITEKWTTYTKYGAYPALYYKRQEKKLFYEERLNPRAYPREHKRATVEVSVSEAKRIVFGTFGSYQLLFDIRNDDREAVNLASEYEGFVTRSNEEYAFDKDYIDESDKPKQVVLGIPSRTSTGATLLKITLGEAKTDAGKRYGAQATGDYAENALIVGDELLEHVRRSEGRSIRITLKPDRDVENGWRIKVKDDDNTIHKVLITGANTIAYQGKLMRINLHDLVNGEKRSFGLFKRIREKLATIDSETLEESNACT